MNDKLPEHPISVREAAERLGVRRERIYQLLREGRLARYCVAHAVFVDADEVAAFKPRGPGGRPRN